MLKRKIIKSVVAGIICVVLISISLVSFTSAEELSVNVRIEGISENLFYGDVTVAFTDELTVKDVLIFINDNYNEITIVGADVNFVTTVNSDSSGTFGGFDGWYYMVNSQAPAVGIGDYVLTGGEKIVLYYADGVTQVPSADISRISEGVIKFTSVDTTYDEQWNATVTTNPVSNATVTWGSGDNKVTYTTDANGEITIASQYLVPGEYKIQIEKYDVNDVDGKFLPLVLRFADDYTVIVPQPAVEETQPGDSTSIAIYVIVVVLAIAAVVLVLTKKKKDK
jgi:hypothetical protein